MSESNRTGARGRMASRLHRIALVALLALAASALLPFTHGSADHSSDCGVCSALAHGGANLADAAPTVDLPHVAVGPELELVERDSALPRRDFTLRLARAPPLASVLA